jgi:hypothetical protein
MAIRISLGIGAAALLASAAARAETGVKVEGTVGAAVEVHQDDGWYCASDDPCERVAAVFAPFGLRGGARALRGVTRDFDAGSVTVGIAPDVAERAGYTTWRRRLSAHLGGGQSGFEWDLGALLLAGGRLGAGAGAPFARAGVDVWFSGNSDYYHSHFEAPRFEVGYQFLAADRVFFEIGGRGGLMLAGRHRVFDRTRDIGAAFDAGGFLTLQLSFLRLNAEALRIFETRNAPETALDRAHADLCAIFSSNLALCMTGSIDRGEVVSGGDAVEITASYLGFALSFGQARITSRTP